MVALSGHAGEKLILANVKSLIPISISEGILT